MKKELIKYCRAINIEHVGIAPAEPYLDFEAVWKKQLQRGYISGFEEKDIQQRVYPALTLEDTKSVIVCLFPYFTGHYENANLSKYAICRDYHTIAVEMLERIAAFLECRIEGFRYKAFADNGPFSDRYLAHKAGLGFWGINNHIINEEYGSYFFIGYILNNYPFEPDRPQEKTCLQCLRCIQACPGQCITGDFTINPQRCKSYITQKKNDLSAEDIQIFRKHGLIWGCDVCQDVCPHNISVRETKIDDFRQHLITRLEYEDLKCMSNKDFKQKYGDRAYSWRGKNILLRNFEITKP